MTTCRSLCFLLTATLIAFTPSYSSSSVTGSSSAPEEVSLGLILDCSASMWNKLEDGRYRMDAAKQALVQFLNTLEERPGLHVGLRLYGSRVHFSKPCACQDSVLVVPIDGFRKKEMLEAVRTAKAIGATPLARSMELMAGDFQHKGFRQLIVFTDGEESCGGDVAEALAKLRSQGIEVDVRLIGIGLPEAAVERFRKLGVPVENAESLAALSEALRTAASPALAKAGQEKTTPAPAATPIRIRVVKDGSPWVTEGLFFRETGDGEAVALVAVGEGMWSGQARPGLYTAGREDSTQSWSNLLVPAQEEPVEFTLDFTEPPKVKMEAATSATTGAELHVKFEGAKGVPEEYIAIVPKGSENLDGPSYARAEGRKEGEVAIVAPAEPGEYELRFISPVGGDLVIAGVFGPIQVQSPSLTLVLAKQVPAMSNFSVEIKGNITPGLWAHLLPQGGTVADSLQEHRVFVENPTVHFTSPKEAGAYEIAVVLQGAEENILVREQFQVVEEAYSVEAPDSAMSGSWVTMRWSGPRGSGIWLTIVPADAEERAHEHYIRIEQAEEEIQLCAPEHVGKAEIRIVSDTEVEQPVVFRRALLLTEPKATLEGPERVKAGQEFEVRWQGPAGSGDSINLAPAGAPLADYITYSTPRDPEHPASFTAPEEPGNYEIRYLTGGHNLLATLSIVVE